jgi:WD40 repeat protein
LAFHPQDPSILATGGGDWGVRVWNTNTRQLLRPPWRTESFCLDLAFNASGTAIAAAVFTDEFELWDWPSGDRHVFLGHSVFVNSIRFLADGRTLVSCGADRLLKFWDIATRQERFSLQSATSIYSCMAISPCETVIAAGTRDGTIRLFRRATVEEVKAAGW